jgi:cobalt/nickel transport system permease protein
MSQHTDGVEASLLTCWEVRCKVAGLLGAAVGVALLRDWRPSLVAWGVALVLSAVGQLRWRWLCSRLFLLGGAALPFALVLPWTLADERSPWWEWGPLALHPYGVEVGVAITLRLWAIGLFAALLIHTTRWSDLLAALRSLGLPASLVWIIALARQYAHVLAHEYRRLRSALRSRGFRMRRTGHSYRTLGYACGALVVQSAERAERVWAAMRCRGFQGDFTPLTPRTSCRFWDLVACTSLWGIMLLLWIWDAPW